MHEFSLVSLHSPVFNAHWAVCLNANGHRADAGFPGVRCPSRWPVPVRSSSIQSTCHFCQWRDTKEMDTETPLHIDSGGCNSQAKGGLSAATSFHFLRVRERETARDWAGDNVSRQKSIFGSHLYWPSARAQCLVTPNVSFGSKGPYASKKRAK